MILPSGKVVGDTEEDPRAMDNHRDRSEVAEALAGRVGRITRLSDTVREELLYVAVPLERDEGLPAVVRLSVPADRGEPDAPVGPNALSRRRRAGGRVRRHGQSLGFPPDQPAAGEPRNGRAGVWRPASSITAWKRPTSPKSPRWPTP